MMHGRKNIKLYNAEQAKPVYQSALIRYTVPPFTESDNTRCCDNKICPPEYGHVNARNISRIVM